MTLNLADQVLILSAVALLFGGFVTGIYMSLIRTSSPTVPKYLRFAHMAGYMQAPILFGVVVALQFSGMSSEFNVATAIVMSLGALVLFGKDVINWRLEVEDEFQDKGIGYQLGALSGIVQVGGLVMLAMAVLTGI